MTVPVQNSSFLMDVSVTMMRTDRYVSFGSRVSASSRDHLASDVLVDIINASKLDASAISLTICVRILTDLDRLQFHSILVGGRHFVLSSLLGRHRCLER